MRTWGLLVIVFALAGNSGCGAVPEASAALAAPTSPQPAVALWPGEAMTFEVSLAGIVGAQGAFAVSPAEVIDGRPVLAVRSRLETAGAAALFKRVIDDATTVVDATTGLPVSLVTDVTVGNDRQRAHGLFDGAKVAVDFWRGEATSPSKSVVDLGDMPAHTAHSVMAQLRTWRPEVGATRTVFVVGGRRIWRADLVFRGSDTISTRFGSRRAIRLDGVAVRTRADRTTDAKAKSREFSVWLSDDADLVPLKVVSTTELGNVVIELTDYQR